ncbi:MAG TPA: hypothetical protein VKM93_18590 [Terriglobia bacterium]|nr:hypothetical protein [Terriglobia bacterium]
MLRKSPTRTEAFLAANRRNALKSTGPRTPEGKARSCMNNLKHGRYAKRLPEKLAAAGNHGGAALYQKIRGEIGTTFQAQPDDPQQMRQLDRMTVAVWCGARRVGINGLKPRSSFFSKRSEPPRISILPIRMADERRRVGIVYWVQRKRYWTPERVILAALNQYPAGVPTLGEALEEKLRHRTFRLGRPGLWDRLRYGLDEQGNRTPGGPEGVRPPRAEASRDHASGASIAGGSVYSNPTVTAARSILTSSLAKLFGGGDAK